jgi:peptidyl-prolyl cis-trans isomerase C
MKSGKRRLFMIAIMAGIFMFALGAQAADQKKVVKKDAAAGKAVEKGNAATVNGVAITQADMDRETQRFEKQVAASGQEVKPEQLAEVQKEVLDSLISREVLYQESQKQGIKVPESEVDSKIAELKKGFPSEEEYKAVLKKMNITEAELRAQLGRQMAMKQLIDRQVVPKVSVTDDEIKAFYDSHPEDFKMQEQVRASHILKKVDPKAGDADKAKAKQELAEIQQRLQKGEDFATLAKEYSNCPSAPKGGDLGFFQHGQMVGPFETAAFALKPGETSEIVETQFGYHLIKVTDKKAAGTVSFDESKQKIADYLKQEKTNNQVTQYIDGLKSKAEIKISSK